MGLFQSVIGKLNVSWHYELAIGLLQSKFVKDIIVHYQVKDDEDI